MSESICTCDIAIAPPVESRSTGSANFEIAGQHAIPQPDRIGRLPATLFIAALSICSFGSSVAPAQTRDANVKQDGVSLSLVVLPPDAAGRVRGALQVDLEPGWKTYWIAPGPVGLAPHLDFSSSEGLSPPRVSFPVPMRFSEGNDVSIGFDRPVAFPFEAAATGGEVEVGLDLLIGICRELCVPVSAHLDARPETGLSARATVASAFAVLPVEQDKPSNWTVTLDRTGSSLDVSVPRIEHGKATADLFVAGPDGWSFGNPILQTAQANEAFSRLSVPIRARPASASYLSTVDLVLTSGESALISRSLPVGRP